MTGDSGIDSNTLWYDSIVNELIGDNERTELATPLKEGSEKETETSSTAPSEGTA